MESRMHRHTVIAHAARLFRAVPLGLILTLSACSGPAGPSFSLDGDIQEWDAQAAAVADGESIFLRFRVPKGPDGRAQTLQHSPKTVALYLDADANTSTGRTSRLKPLNQLGVDLEIRFSPTENGTLVPGTRTLLVDRQGGQSQVSNAATGLIVSPTYASEWFEARLDRSKLPALAAGNASSTESAQASRLSGMFVTLDDSGSIDGYADPFSISLPPLSSGPGPVVDVPAKAQGLVRVVSFNIQKSSPVKEPGAFSRILTLLDADIVLIQEWDEGDAVNTQEWFRSHAVAIESPFAPAPKPNGTGPWRVHKGPGTGVGIASRWPITALPPDSLDLTTPGVSSGAERPRRVRAASALVATDAGPVAVTSLHLKCCGGASTSEETLRQNESRSLNKALDQVYRDQAVSAAARIIAGDFNLVGTRAPLDILRAGLDSDGTDLAVAEPFTLGTAMKYTWLDDSSPFLPGRLDYLLYSDSTAEVVRAFVLDTQRLSFESLARSGLDATDSRASDHMPVVVDLQIK